MIKGKAKDESNHVHQLKDAIKEAKSLELVGKDETLRLRLKHVGPSVTLFCQDNPMKMVKGCGQYLYDELGNRYLDCINNVSHVGHGNKRVLEAVSKQLSLLNTNSRFLHDNLSIYAEKLCAYFPPHLSICYLVNSGSEANDLAIRLARAYTKRKDIVSLDGAYHGNLISTMAISPFKNDHISEVKPPKWAHVAPLPCMYRGEFSRDRLTNLAPDSDAVGALFASSAQETIERVKSKGRQVAAFFVESMISCGGQTPLPPGYLRHMQNYLHQEGSLLVCDEVQTGFGRCGKHMWAFQLGGEDIKPDIVTIGKPMGNGFPVSAVITTPAIGAAFKNIGTEYFNTFGGNPVSCAAALAVLSELEEKRLMKEADKIGSYMMSKLVELQVGSTVLGDIRGCGFFIGIELVYSLDSKKPSPEYAQFIVRRFNDHKIIMNTEGKFGNVLKFKPPMVFNMDDARRFLEVLSSSLQELELHISQAGPLGTSLSSRSCSSSSSVSSSSWLESSCEL